MQELDDTASWEAPFGKTFVMMLEKLLVGGAASHDGASCLRLIAPGITNQYSFRLVAAK